MMFASGFALRMSACGGKADVARPPQISNLLCQQQFVVFFVVRWSLGRWTPGDYVYGFQSHHGFIVLVINLNERCYCSAIRL